MLNPIETYADAGTKAGLARVRHDEGLASHWSEWTRRAIALEKPEDRHAARAAFDKAYSAQATPKPMLG